MPSDPLIEAKHDVDQAKAALRAWGVHADEQVRAELREHLQSMKASAVDTARKSSLFTTAGALFMGMLTGRTAKKAKLPKLVSLATAIGIARTALPIARMFLARR
ncbi:MAG: hypothetical protein K2Q20_03245 [Phycisphaerales bacterium]|nr:hypothetical protein [Phycisphaerales bacterium]